MLRQLPATATHKPKKGDLLQDGYNPAKTKDPIFLDDGRIQAYRIVTDELFRRVQSGQIRV
jgi:fatty-acyl-CoA synthase